MPMHLPYLGQSYLASQPEINNIETIERTGIYRGVTYRVKQQSAQPYEAARIRYRGVDYQR